MDDLLATLAGGKTFTKLGLAHAYHQLVLEEQSRKLTTINTPRGLFEYTRLPFGTLVASAIFQRTMENLLQGTHKVCVYLDDVLVTGCSHEEHLDNLNQVLCRLSGAGMKLKHHKCQFMLPQVQYLGHMISRRGIQATEDKVQAIREALTPHDIHQLKSFLGLLNLLCEVSFQFVDHTGAPLFSSTEEDTLALGFVTTRGICQGQVHYCDQSPLVLSTDASPYGVGAVLSHSFPDDSEKPTA